MIKNRPRRNRQSAHLREMLSETNLHAKNFVLPVFMTEGSGKKEEISAMPDYFRYSLDLLLGEIEKAMKLGITGFALFPKVPEDRKDSKSSEAVRDDNLIVRATIEIKKRFPESILFGDVALDPYSSDGHDGIVENGKILNDATLEVLAKMSVLQAQAGIDYVAPSDMMDGRIGFIRSALDECGHEETGIMAYTAKYASSFYGPFRAALDSAPKAGDKKTYQMDFRNRGEALRELRLDEEECADMVMVKPALAYLDIISDFKTYSHLPVAAYNVSGEYSMIKAAAARGFLDERGAALESLTAIKRAGADVIFTYWAMQAATWLKT